VLSFRLIERRFRTLPPHRNSIKMSNAATDFISTGGNRHPSAADWDPEGSGLLAFGADSNVALWDPLVRKTFHRWSFSYAYQYKSSGRAMGIRVLIFTRVTC